MNVLIESVKPIFENLNYSSLNIFDAKIVSQSFKSTIYKKSDIIIKTLMNDILCQKCNAKQSKINLEFRTFYKCQICENTCCINCMYLCCSICNKEFICFWCGTDFKHSNNISITEK